MHYLMLATLTLSPGQTSRDVREQAYSRLLDDPSFCGDGGRFGSPLCDWFVIGGRWSGYLRKTFIGQPYRDALEQRFPKLAGQWYSDSDVAPHRLALDDLWHQFDGTGPSPYSRSSYEQLGYDDDALPVDQAVYDEFLAEYRGEPYRKENSYTCPFADLDGEEADVSFIGRKWIVVIDYHN